MQCTYSGQDSAEEFYEKAIYDPLKTNAEILLAAAKGFIELGVTYEARLRANPNFSAQFLDIFRSAHENVKKNLFEKAARLYYRTLNHDDRFSNYRILVEWLRSIDAKTLNRSSIQEFQSAAEGLRSLGNTYPNGSNKRVEYHAIAGALYAQLVKHEYATQKTIVNAAAGLADMKKYTEATEIYQKIIKDPKISAENKVLIQDSINEIEALIAQQSATAN